MNHDRDLTAFKEEHPLTRYLQCRSGAMVSCPDPACPSHKKVGVKQKKTWVTDSFWCCYSCNAKGDIFEWVMLEKGVNFKNALHLLGGGRNVVKAVSDERIAKLTALVGAANRYLMKNKDNRNYLTNDRGLSTAVLFQNLIGLIDHDGVVLRDSGLSRDELLSLGVLRPNVQRGTGDWCLMAGRIILPIKNQRGQIVQIKGRVHPGLFEKVPDAKCLSLPRSNMFMRDDWEEVSANDYLFLEHLLYRGRQAGYILLCEGELDALTLLDRGFPAVALQGNMGIEKHFYKFKDIPVIYDVRDNDDATERLLPDQHFKMQAALPNVEIRRVRLPKPPYVDKVDVNDYFARYGYGVSDFKVLMQQAPPVSSVLIEVLAEGFRQGDDTAFDRLRSLYRAVDCGTQDELICKVSRITEQPEQTLRFVFDSRERARAS